MRQNHDLMKIVPQQVLTPYTPAVYFLGPPFEEGPMPCFMYFSLSGEESLSLSPYNHPILPFLGEKIRVFSITLPAHGPGFDKFKAMDLWSDWAYESKDFLSPFLADCVSIIAWLVHQHIVDSHKLVLAGLSRGAFIATHIAARLKSCKALLGFAPMTTLTTIQEFIDKKDHKFITQMQTWDLQHIAPLCLHVNHCRFYIGNRDMRVCTDACFSFIRSLADCAYDKRSKISVEMRIYPSIGHKGHGTPPQIFEEGGQWLKRFLKPHGES
jgi:predicted esterase